MPHNIKSLPALERLLTWSLRHPIAPVQSYGFVFVAVVLVGVFRALVITSILPWLFFIPVILLCALILGRDAGILASVLSTIVAAVTIGNSAHPFWMTHLQWIGSGLFLVITTAMAIVVAELRHAYARAQKLALDNIAVNLRLAEREAFLSSVLASSTDCIKVLDLDGRITFMSEGGMRVMDVSDFNEISGCPWPDFWVGSGNREAENAIAAAREGKASSFIGNAFTMAGVSKWWDVAISPILDAEGRPERILSVSRDISASRATDERNDQLSRIVEASTDFISMANLDGEVFFMNDAACSLVGLQSSDAQKVKVGDFFAPEEAEVVETLVLPMVASSGHWSGERYFRHFQTGELIPVLYTVFPVSDSDGDLIGYGTVTRDLREQKKAEAQQQLLTNELSHRLKNVLSVVQSVVGQTIRQSESLQSASEAVAARLSALGQATSVLTANSWNSAEIHEMLEAVLAPHADIGQRIVIDGPRMTLKPQGVLAFALAFHELATNAAKYGALSNADGSITIRWHIDTKQPPGDPRLKLSWQETGGPPVAVPTRKGFGSTLIERSLRAYFQGSAKLDYQPGGLLFEIDCPLQAAVMETQ